MSDARDEALAGLAFIKLPKELAGVLGDFRLDPEISLPLALDPGAHSARPEDISRERILSGILRYLAHSDDEERCGYYRQLIKAVQPELFSALCSEGQSRLDNKEYELAGEIFEAAAGLEPDSALAQLNLASLYEALAERAIAALDEEGADELYGKVQRAYSRAKASEESHPQAFFRSGLFRLKVKDFEGALVDLESALRLGLEGDDAERVGFLLDKLKNQGLLDSLFKEAYDYIRLGREEEGLVRLERFLEAYPEVWNGHFLRGWALRRLERWDEARPSFERALELMDEEGEAVDCLNELSICYMELGRYAESRSCLERALRIEGENVKIISNLGILHAKMGREGEARAFFRAALEIDPQDPIAKAFLGQDED